MHAMRAPNESIESAHRRACEFIRSNLLVFEALKNSPTAKNVESGYRALGAAPHPIMDSTPPSPSPSHSGWKHWQPNPSDLWNPGGQIWEHGDNSQEDLAHLTADLNSNTIAKMLEGMNPDNCECVLSGD